MKKSLPACEGGAPVRARFLPFARPSIGQDEIDRVTEVLRSGWLTVGPKTRELERAVAEYVGVKHAAALSSCTAGLHLSMAALGVGPGDEVVLPALNFAAGANVTLHLGARPVLVDVDPVTLNVTAEILDAAATPRTKVFMPVHFGGRPCPMDAIMEAARGRGVRVVADAAHAIGSEYRGRRVGAMADATAFSFYVTKGITTGEGGMVTSHDEALVAKVACLSLHGMSSDAWKRYSDRGPWYYEILEAGYKCNMNDVQAAIGLCQMERIGELGAARGRIASAYAAGFADLDGLTVPPPCDDGVHAWHLYTIQIDPRSVRVDRDRFIRCILDEGIGVSVHFIPIHYHPYFRDHLGYGAGAFPATEAYFERAVSLPIYPTMTESDVADAIDAVRKVMLYYKR
ncbi:MAG: DegT/DnrJ/EryC1/StrS aminotransferase family protein [Candidatus Eisenbacteria bacterium]|nr:DegT/DnrJ/EryC1/StrS aminotransferase family protein [Candidatus Eisenbacteria bacterium]